MKYISYNTDSINQELIPLLRTLSEEYPIKENIANSIQLKILKQDSGLNIESDGKTALISYSSLSDAARGIGHILSHIDEPLSISEKSAFETFGLLIDCSRNATLKVSYFKRYLRKLALMGYNMAMLYTKDAYELPDEDFFGYLRGSYSLSDLQEIDNYAAKLGIEMIGSIQALGHLEPTLQWPAYYKLRDTSSVIHTSNEKSYELIRKILEFWAEAFKSRKIHLGMDETHDLGRGKFMDMNGYKRGYDIFNDHLKRVNGDCANLGLQPIIWSDMYFRMGSKHGDYYDKTLEIPKDIKYDIPKTVQLSYWDYYHDNEAFYIDWINRHRECLEVEPTMASGIWSWHVLWHNHKKTVKTAVPCIDACRKLGIKDFYFTVWADDGAFCNLESVLAGACSMAEKVFSKTSEMNENKTAKLFAAICKSDYSAHQAMADLTIMPESNGDNIYDYINPYESIDARSILWDDPLLQIYRKNQVGGNLHWQSQTIKNYKKIAEKIANVPDGDEGCFGYGKILLNLLILKLELMEKLEDAYFARNIDNLNDVAKQIPDMISLIESFISSFRRYQYDRYNSQGFEILQIRLGGLKERFNEVILRIEEFVSGDVNSIPELDEKAFNPSVNKNYSRLATASYFV